MYEEALFLLNLCFPIVIIQSCVLPSMESCMILSVKMVLYGFCTANQLSDFSSRMKNTRYSYRMANHLSVSASVGIGSIDPFAHYHLRPTFAGLKLVTVIPSQILLGIPQTRFRLSGPQEWPPIILAYTTKVLTSGLGPWIRDPREYTPAVVQ